MLRTHTPSSRLITLHAQGADTTHLTAGDLQKARPHQVWYVKSPEHNEDHGIIFMEVMALGQGRFAIMRQYRNIDGTEVAEAPEYFVYRQNEIVYNRSFAPTLEDDEFRRYPHYQQVQYAEMAV
jgi:hypothetical protein